MLAELLFEEKQCTGCREFWPADTEFFHRDTRSASGLRNRCKACYAELPSVQRRQEMKRARK